MIGTILKELRNSKKLTQEKVAKQISVARSTYTYYEREGRSLNPDILIRLADFYDVSIDYLLGRTTFPNTPSPKKTSVFSPAELDLIKKYRCLDDSRQEAVRDLVNTGYEKVMQTQKNTDKLIS